MELAQTPMRSFEVTVASALGETYLVKGRLAFRLNPVGVEIWNELEGDRTLRSIAETVSEKYGTPVSVVSEDVSTFCDELLSRGMIESS